MSHNSTILRLAIFVLALFTLSAVSAVPALAASQQTGNRVCAGKSLTVPAGQSTGDLVSFGCKVSIEPDAVVQGNIMDFGSNYSIAGTVNGDITTFGGNFSLDSSAVVNGDIVPIGGSVERAAGAVVRGTVLPPPGAPPAPLAPPTFFANRAFAFGFDIFRTIVWTLAFAALGALVVIFVPEQTRRVSHAIQAKPLNTWGVGCLTFIVLLFMCGLFFITLIGIPVSALLGVATFIALLFGSIALGYLLGERILQAFRVRDILPVVAVVVGLVVLALVSQVPLLNCLLSLIIPALALGAVVLTRFGTRPYPTPPTMTLVPVAPGAPPGTYTPSAVDTAAWEAKAREAQARQETTPPTPMNVPDSTESSLAENAEQSPPESETPPGEAKASEPPA